MIDVVGKRFWYFLFSALIILPGVISMAIPSGMKLAECPPLLAIYFSLYPLPVVE